MLSRRQFPAKHPASSKMAMLEYWRAIRRIATHQNSRQISSAGSAESGMLSRQIDCLGLARVQHRRKRRYKKLSVTDDAYRNSVKPRPDCIFAMPHPSKSGTLSRFSAWKSGMLSRQFHASDGRKIALPARREASHPDPASPLPAVLQVSGRRPQAPGCLEGGQRQDPKGLIAKARARKEIPVSSPARKSPSVKVFSKPPVLLAGYSSRSWSRQ